MSRARNEGWRFVSRHGFPGIISIPG